MDEARRIVEGKFALDRADDDALSASATLPTSFLVSATTQSNGRGTANRNWEGSRGGNALLTIGVPQASWMDGLRSRNDGRAVPLTLLPLKVGSLVAYHTRRALRECVPRLDDDGAAMPAVTVKWPNDVLLRVDDEVGDDGSSSSSGPTHEKIAGILVETSRDWFLVGIGINIGYAPHVPSEGNNRGRKATCLARYCRVDGEVEDGSSEDDATAIEGGEERHWIEASRKLATDVAYDLHSWLHSDARRHHSGESILEDWKSYVDWDMELTLRDTPNMERVTLEGVLEDGRAVVKEVETGLTRTLVSDYFL
jgi:biotin-(acetyl-CoA carboxylase) ligase